MERREGFTLIELLVVVAIIAILAAIAIPQYAKYRKNAAISAAQSAVSSCVTTLNAQYSDNGTTTYTCKVGSNEVVLSFLDNGTVEYDSTATSSLTDGATVNSVDNATFKVSGYNIWCYLNNADQTVQVQCGSE